MTTHSHHSRIDQQFGSQASAYVQSEVHAKGNDLAYLASLVETSSFSRGLDLGCGGGHVAYTIALHVKDVVAYDLSQAMVDAVRNEANKRGLSGICTQVGAAEKLPFDDASFDFVCTRYSAHHWRDLDAGLREAHRVLVPGGICVCIDVISPEDPLYATFLQTIELLRDPSHVRNYTIAEWSQALQRAGFKAIEVYEDRLPMSFLSWLARMKPPEIHIQAIESLRSMVAQEALVYFRLDEPDQFSLYTGMFTTTK